MEIDVYCSKNIALFQKSTGPLYFPKVITIHLKNINYIIKTYNKQLFTKQHPQYQKKPKTKIANRLTQAKTSLANTHTTGNVQLSYFFQNSHNRHLYCKNSDTTQKRCLSLNFS